MQLIELKSIHLENFMSFEDCYMEINQNVVTSIKGINHDDQSTESNGSGKSALLEALYYGLTGNSLRSSSSKGFVRIGCEGGKVTLIIVKNNKQTLTVVREINLKGKSPVEVYIDGGLKEDLLDQHPKETNKFILDFIGLTYNDLVNTYITHKERYKSFISMSDREKKEFISRFCGLDSIDSAIEAVDLDISKQKDKASKINELIHQITGSLQTTESTFSSLDVSMHDKITREEEKIQDFEKELKEATEEYSEIASEIKQWQEKIDHNKKQVKLRLEEKNDLSEKKKALQKESDDLREDMDLLREEKDKVLSSFIEKESGIREELGKAGREVTKIETEIDKVSAKVDKMVECPACDHQFTVDTKDDIDSIEKQLDSLDQDLKEAKEKVKTITSKLEKAEKKKATKREELSEDIDFIRSQITSKDKEVAGVSATLRRVEREISEIQETISSFEKEIEKLKSTEDPTKEIENKILFCKKSIERIQQETQEEKSDTQNKIDLLKKQIENKNKELEKNNEEEMLLNDCIQTFKSFKTHLINSFLKSIENSANRLLKDMKTPIRLRILGYKKLRSGDLREKIEIKSTRDGIVEEEVAMMSSGEKAKIDMALMFARQQMIASSTESDFNMLWVDEVCESLDSMAMSNLINSLSNLNKTCLLTTHSHPIEAVDCNRLTIHKENSISKIQDHE